MKRQIGRGLALALGILLLALAGYLFRAAWRRHSWFTGLRKEQILKSQVDLSQRTKYAIPFCLEHKAPLGIWIDVAMMKRASSREEAVGPLQGIRGAALITDSNNEVAWKEEFSDRHFNCRKTKSGSYSPALSLTGPLGKGKYVLNLEVREPAVLLAEVRHGLTASYMVCGCMVMGAYLAGLTAYVIGGIGMAIVAVVTIRVYQEEKSRRRRKA